MALWEIFVRVLRHFYRYLYMLRDKSERIKLLTELSGRLISDLNCLIAMLRIAFACSEFDQGTLAASPLGRSICSDV